MKCILHIGTEKTATTLLQEWLYENEENLSKQGIALTRAGGFPNNRKLVSFFSEGVDDFLKQAGVSQAEREKFYEPFGDELRAELGELSKDHHTVIFTSEHFHSRVRKPAEVRAIREFLDRDFSDYQIICYFREQSRVRTSLYSTALKVGHAVTLDEFQIGISTEDHYYNYLAFFQKWEGVFGLESLRPRLFDPARLEAGDIRLDFLKTVLPDVDASALNFDSRSANKSLSQSEAEIFRAINIARPQYIGHFTDPTPLILKDIVQGLKFLSTNEPLSDQRQASIYDAFHEANLEFFERYFGVRRNLFAPPKAIPRTRKDLSLSKEETIELISQIARTENLIVIRQTEINFLRDLAVRLHETGAVSAQEAASLLKIAHRARPRGGWLKNAIDKLLR